MKKEGIAAGIILILIVGAVINVLYLRHFTDDITERIHNSQTYCAQEDYDTAESELRSALDIWLEADWYTHIFIRHAEVDSTSDAFYDTLSCLIERDQDSAVSAYEKLLYHIDSIVSMEHVTLKSVL